MAEHPTHYPIWLRGWHWLNASLFLCLIVTGASLHFTRPDGAWIDFATARMVHNLAGMVLAANYVFYLAGNALSGNWRFYIPPRQGFLQGLAAMNRFYAVGIFRGEPMPFTPEVHSKFNPMQQVTYLGVMYGVMPVLVLSGLLFLFPEWLPAQFFGFDGLTPVAVVHYLTGLFLTLFMAGHIYLATAGPTLTSEFRKMILGSH